MNTYRRNHRNPQLVLQEWIPTTRHSIYQLEKSDSECGETAAHGVDDTRNQLRALNQLLSAAFLEGSSQTQASRGKKRKRISSVSKSEQNEEQIQGFKLFSDTTKPLSLKPPPPPKIQPLEQPAEDNAIELEIRRGRAAEAAIELEDISKWKEMAYFPRPGSGKQLPPAIMRIKKTKRSSAVSTSMFHSNIIVASRERARLIRTPPSRPSKKEKQGSETQRKIRFEDPNLSFHTAACVPQITLSSNPSIHSISDPSKRRRTISWWKHRIQTAHPQWQCSLTSRDQSRPAITQERKSQAHSKQKVIGSQRVLNPQTQPPLGGAPRQPPTQEQQQPKKKTRRSRKGKGRVHHTPT